MRTRRRQLLGLKALVHDAIDTTTELVREGNESTARGVLRGVLAVADDTSSVARAARAIDGVRRATTDGVLASVRLVNRAVEVVTDKGIEAALHVADARALPDEESSESAVPLRSDATERAAWWSDASVALVNAAVGDYLHRASNGLDVGMALRVGDRYVEAKEGVVGDAWRARGGSPGARLALYVHGLGTSEWSWSLEAAAYHGDPTATFGSLLERDLRIAPLWLRYNTGRHISENGRALAELLEHYVAAHEREVGPIEELVLVGHSMGGLVVRSACHVASVEGLAWLGRVRRVFSLGSPHAGAPLAKLGHLATRVLGAIDLPGTLIPARILEGRSAGMKDLRFGSLVDDDWLGRDPDALAEGGATSVPLLPGIRYAFVSATVTRDAGHPVGVLLGDLLVREGSALGAGLTRASDDVVEQRDFRIETARFGGVMHHQLQNHPAVYEILRAACDDRRASRSDDGRDR